MLCVGAAVLDFVASVSEYPLEDSKVRTNSHQIAGGGNGANTATAIAKLGLPCSILSKIGTDANGSFIENELRKCGVATTYLLADPTDVTAYTYVISSQSTATRTCIHTPLCMELSPQQVDEMNVDFSSLAYIHFDSRHTIAACHIARKAKEHEIRLSIDAEKMKPHMEHLLPLCDIIFTNEHFPKLHSPAM